MNHAFKALARLPIHYKGGNRLFYAKEQENVTENLKALINYFIKNAIKFSIGNSSEPRTLKEFMHRVACCWGKPLRI